MAGVAVAAILASLTAAMLTSSPEASAQTTPEAPSLLGLSTSPQAPEGRMLIEADNLVYDIDTERVSAIGGVVIYFGGYTLVADRVDLDRATETVSASGSVEITDAAGNVVRGSRVELTDDLREGVVEGLELVTEERVAFSAARATRQAGNVTTFEDGVYLPCVDCDGIPGRKPVWQIRAQRIIHRQGERTITLEQAQFEFLGVPIAWVPVLTQPDPTVRRKSGFLIPSFSYGSQRGFGIKAPYFYVLAPNMDVTVTPGGFTEQGPYGEVEFRHRMISGSYSIRLAGLHQQNPNEFEGTSGDRDWRGGASTEGRFAINERWNWGWDLAAATDRSFFDDYDVIDGDDDMTNDVFLTGVDQRNRFDGHFYGFYVTEEDSLVPGAPEQDRNLQEKQPFVHPVIDHQVYAEEPLAGGEFSVTSNFTSLSRTDRDVYEFDSDGDGNFGIIDGEPTRLRGAAGTFTRASVDALWRRRFVDSIGQVFTPFVAARGDVLFSDPTDSSQASLDDDGFSLRGMPTAGVEYSIPLLVQAASSTSVIEPVAQLIVRPSEAEVGDFPNEDAQSLVFDATNLFDYDKFSGYDRVEGGGRLNLGLRYTGRFNAGVTVTGVAGQSLHLFGTNSFERENAFDTGRDSGLDSDASDYVAALSVNSGLGLLVNGAIRLDQEDVSPNRVEGQVVGLAGPLSTMLTYAYIRRQPDFGIEDDRSEIQAAANLQIDRFWRLFGASRYDLTNDTFVRHAVGFAYDDESFSASLSYSEDKTRSTGEPVDRTVYFRLGLRTLGDTSGSADVLR